MKIIINNLAFQISFSKRLFVIGIYYYMCSKKFVMNTLLFYLRKCE